MLLFFFFFAVVGFRRKSLVRLEADLLDDLSGELGSGSGSSKISSAEERGLINVANSLFDVVGVVSEAHVSQHHRSGENESSGVCDILSTDIETDVTSSRLENGNLFSKVSTGDDTGASNETAGNVGDDVSVQVGRYEHVKLAWVGHQLHASVIDNHFTELNLWVLLSNATSSVQEQTVRHLHNVSLVDRVDLLAAVCLRILESKTSYLLALLCSRHLQRLHYTRNSLVLQTRILSLYLLADHYQVDALVASLDGGQRANRYDFYGLLERATNKQVTRHRSVSVLSMEGTLQEHSVASNT